MSVKVTAEIRAGLRKLIDEWGSALEIERRTHVANSSISRYLSGFLPRMNDTTWRALYPHLAKYLPDPPDVEEFLPTATPSPSEDIFRRIVYSEALSDEEKIKFLKMILTIKDIIYLISRLQVNHIPLKTIKMTLEKYTKNYLRNIRILL